MSIHHNYMRGAGMIKMKRFSTECIYPADNFALVYRQHCFCLLPISFYCRLTISLSLGRPPLDPV